MLSACCTAARKPFQINYEEWNKINKLKGCSSIWKGATTGNMFAILQPQTTRSAAGWEQSTAVAHTTDRLSIVVVVLVCLCSHSLLPPAGKRNFSQAQRGVWVTHAVSLRIRRIGPSHALHLDNFCVVLFFLLGNICEMQLMACTTFMQASSIAATPSAGAARAATASRRLVPCIHVMRWPVLTVPAAAAAVWGWATITMAAAAMASPPAPARIIISRWNSIASRCSARLVLANRRSFPNFAPPTASMPTMDQVSAAAVVLQKKKTNTLPLDLGFCRVRWGRAKHFNYSEWHRVGAEVPHWQSGKQGKSSAKAQTIHLSKCTTHSHSHTKTNTHAHIYFNISLQLLSFRALFAFVSLVTSIVVVCVRAIIAVKYININLGTAHNYIYNSYPRHWKTNFGIWTGPTAWTWLKAICYFVSTQIQLITNAN